MRARNNKAKVKVVAPKKTNVSQGQAMRQSARVGDS